MGCEPAFFCVRCTLFRGERVFEFKSKQKRPHGTINNHPRAACSPFVSRGGFHAAGSDAAEATSPRPCSMRSRSERHCRSITYNM